MLLRLSAMMFLCDCDISSLEQLLNKVPTNSKEITNLQRFVRHYTFDLIGVTWKISLRIDHYPRGLAILETMHCISVGVGFDPYVAGVLRSSYVEYCIVLRVAQGNSLDCHHCKP